MIRQRNDVYYIYDELEVKVGKVILVDGEAYYVKSDKRMISSRVVEEILSIMQGLNERPAEDIRQIDLFSKGV